MLKIQTKLDDLLKKYKDLNHAHVTNKLEEYDDLVQYYSIIHTKQQMEDSNTKFNEWWEVAKVQFKEEMYKNLATHKKDEDMYRRHLSTLKRFF
jgi:hypothetical protein